MNERSPDHDQTPLFSRRERWCRYGLPMFGVVVGGFIGIVAAFALAGGHEAAVPFFAIFVGVLGAVCGLVATLGITAARSLSNDTHRSVPGCLMAGAVGGAAIGNYLGYACASTGPLDANMGPCGTLIGAIIGVWLGVAIDLFGSCQPRPGRTLTIDRPLLLKFLLLIGLTVWPRLACC